MALMIDSRGIITGTRLAVTSGWGFPAPSQLGLGDTNGDGTPADSCPCLDVRIGVMQSQQVLNADCIESMR